MQFLKCWGCLRHCRRPVPTPESAAVLSSTKNITVDFYQKKNHKAEEMAKAETIIEFTLENLQLLQGHESFSPRQQVVSLSEDLKYIRNLIRRVHENYEVSDLVANIVDEVGILLVSTDLYVQRYVVKGVRNLDIHTSFRSSPYEYILWRYKDPVKAIRSLKNHFLDFSGQIETTGSDEHEAMVSRDHQVHIIVDLALKDLEMLITCTKNERRELSLVYEDLEFLSSTIQSVSRYSGVLDQIVTVVGELLDIMDEYLEGVNMENFKIIDNRGSVIFLPKVLGLIQKMKSVEQELLIVPNVVGSDRKDGSSSANTLSTRNFNTIAEEKVVIGMEDETKRLLNRLIGGWKQLQLIPVIGMAGIGKTTLARKLYNDPSIACHFHIRTWAAVSQSYQNRKLLRDILGSIIGDKDPVLSSSVEDIGEKLRRCLKGRRYLIVLDDAWDVQVWKCLQMYLPKDDNSSRVIITSRNKEVVPKEMISKNPPHFLHLLTDNESWDLFRFKVFGSTSFTEELMRVGKEIVATCKGLPIAIVVMGGLLAKEEKSAEIWTEFAISIRSSANNNIDFDHLMDILGLSYKQLPFPLKSCFLYLGSFPEDYEFPVKLLIRSWIAHHFIEPAPGMELEDVAEGYVKDLIDRSLLIVAKRRSDGGIQSCQIHDLLRGLSIRKATEKNFLQPICRCGSNDEPYRGKRLNFYDCQYFHIYDSHHVYGKEVLSDNWTIVKFLSLLDLRRAMLYEFPDRIFELFHLKYLALQFDRIKNLPDSLFELWHLETFILEVEKGSRCELVPSIMKMRSLRHFHVSQEMFCDPRNWLVLDHSSKSINTLSVLDNLQTISTLSASDSIHSLLSRTPNLRKLGLHASVSVLTNEQVVFPTLSYLQVLETLKFEYQTLGMMPFTIPSFVDFPQSLKKLTLIGSHVEWSSISTIARLPNLQVLKLKDNFFSGPRWETSDDDFQSLKYLKLSHMDLKQWVSSSEHFPKLEQLVVNGCIELEEIPAEFGDIPTMQGIKVYRSSNSVAESAKEIHETQNSFGNYDFTVSIFEHFQEL